MVRELNFVNIIVMVSIVVLILAIVSIGGFVGAYLFGRKTKNFRWSEYIALLAAPVFGSLSLSYFYGVKIIYLFLISSVVGFILEYSVGLAYHKTLNKRLWTYDRYSVGGYTSFLTFPMWGVVGIIFWLISRYIGI